MRNTHDEPNPWKWFAVIVAGVLVGGLLLYQLIVWNEQRGMEQAIAQLERENERLEAEYRSRAVIQPAPPPRRTSIAADGRHRPAALREGERCINGQRFRRLDNGWEEIPQLPC